MARQASEKSIYRVAEQLGVSIATVSRVVNNRIGVSETTRRKVLECIQQMGYKASCGNTRPKYVAVINFYPVPTEYNRKLLEALFIHFRLICAKSRFFAFPDIASSEKEVRLHCNGQKLRRGRNSEGLLGKF